MSTMCKENMDSSDVTTPSEYDSSDESEFSSPVKIPSVPDDKAALPLEKLGNAIDVLKSFIDSVKSAQPGSSMDETIFGLTSNNASEKPFQNSLLNMFQSLATNDKSEKDENKDQWEELNDNDAEIANSAEAERELDKLEAYAQTLAMEKLDKQSDQAVHPHTNVRCYTLHTQLNKYASVMPLKAYVVYLKPVSDDSSPTSETLRLRITKALTGYSGTVPYVRVKTIVHKKSALLPRRKKYQVTFLNGYFVTAGGLGLWTRSVSSLAVLVERN